MSGQTSGNTTKFTLSALQDFRKKVLDVMYNDIIGNQDILMLKEIAAASPADGTTGTPTTLLPGNVSYFPPAKDIVTSFQDSSKGLAPTLYAQINWMFTFIPQFDLALASAISGLTKGETINTELSEKQFWTDFGPAFGTLGLTQPPSGATPPGTTPPGTPTPTPQGP